MRGAESRHFVPRIAIERRMDANGSREGRELMASQQRVATPRHHTPTIEGPLTARSLAVVLPAYNEEAVIAETVRVCVQVLSIVAPDFEVIVVNDGSRDHTGAIADELA